jgi:hypothetical protein
MPHPVVDLRGTFGDVSWSIAPGDGLFVLGGGLSCRSHPLGELLPAGLTVPLFKGLIRNFAFYQQLSKLPTLRLTLERHHTPFRLACSGPGFAPLFELLDLDWCKAILRVGGQR